MRNGPLRFFVVEHPFGMVVSLALAHIGRARLKRATDSGVRHRTALIFFGLSLLVMMASIPWPAMPAGRPLFRGVASAP
jgi:predicted membrane channel-forming protein YqfA (hemolysin III family)